MCIIYKVFRLISDRMVITVEKITKMAAILKLCIIFTKYRCAKNQVSSSSQSGQDGCAQTMPPTLTMPTTTTTHAIAIGSFRLMPNEPIILRFSENYNYQKCPKN